MTKSSTLDDPSPLFTEQLKNHCHRGGDLGPKLKLGDQLSIDGGVTCIGLFNQLIYSYCDVPPGGTALELFCKSSFEAIRLQRGIIVDELRKASTISVIRPT